MPATEQTSYNQKVLHVIFGVSALVMTLATLWMTAKDHNREWKRWQLADRKKEAQIVQAQRDLLADQFSQRMETYDLEIRQIKSQPIAREVIEEFKGLIQREDERLSTTDGNFSALDAATGFFNEAAKEAQNLANAENPDSEQATDLLLARNEAIEARRALFNELAKFIDEATRREKQLVGRRKFVKADQTASVSELGLMVGGGEGKDELAATQERIQGFADRIAGLTEQIAVAYDYRTNLEAIRGQLDAELIETIKQRDALETDLARLDDQVYKSTSNVLEWITRWPVLDALYDGNVRIDQIWLPDMTINFNFSQVARFDRCKSCHRAISQSAPGTAADPAYPTLPEADRNLTLALQTPDSAPEEGASLRDAYGMKLSGDSLVGYADAVLVHYVLPGSPAAQAGLESGDVIVEAGDVPVYEPAAVEGFLLEQVKWGEPTEVKIRRGLDHPFTTHPRLDLYLSDSSPHPEKVMGCTICHDGQGSGTEFPWTSHTPDNSKQQVAWTREHGWFDNHHWIFPMKASRFAESNCTKCHYDKASLEPSERFPEPPAAKLVEGWTLVEKYGCFGCHEISGYEGPLARIGPDLRLEPNYSAVAQQISRDGGLTDDEHQWAKTLVETPGDEAARNRLLVAIKQDAQLASRSGSAEESRLTAGTHKLAGSLKDVEVPGAYRKVGPSLRFLGAKVDFDWLYSWIRKPADFRPSTRMPQFFGQHEHLQDLDKDELKATQDFEKVEIRALTEFLLANSSEFQYLSPPEGVTEPPSAERGKWLFETRGCLACHSHESFSDIAADQGPDLSQASAKFNSEKGALWLYSWLKQPHLYHARTKMPNLYLDPIVEKDATGQPTGKVTDPAADIAVFLLGRPVEWAPTDVPPPQWTTEEQAALAGLAVEWLASDTVPVARAQQFVRDGIPNHLEPKLKANEKLLLKKNFGNRVEALKQFVAHRTIGKYGCFGCHDIPGFEGEKTIGTSLADWGRKETSRLAFGNIHKFLEGPGHPHGDPGAHGKDAGHGHLDPGDFDDDTSYYIQALNSHGRDGFIWQKLRMPRSYDYKTTRNKGFNERLRMPKFPFSADEREAVICFVLGLVSEPPAEKFVYHASPERQAIVDGRMVLDRFNCAGCHTLEMERWQIAFEEGQFDSPSKVVDFPFLDKLFPANQVAESLVKDSAGRYHATLDGQPVMNEETGLPERFDEDSLPLEPDDDESDPYYRFTLWKDALVEGEAWLVGLQDLMVPADRDGYGPDNGQAYPAWGGDLARYLYPKLIAHARQANPQVKGSEAWGWLPPPLMAEGEKVQSDWLHGFLMDPTALRPAVVMRMPNFKMSSLEAAKLVNYFAAASDADFPYEYKPQQRASYLAQAEALHPERLIQAMNIVVDGNYCVKCHAVADFQPEGDVTTFGPNLADVYRRLRPSYVRNWIANPKRLLPYTGMPVNVIYKPEDSEHLGGVAQALFAGTSLEQLRGLVDLLMNFDVYAKRQTSITPLVKAVPAGNSRATNVGGATAPRR